MEGVISNGEPVSDGRYISVIRVNMGYDDPKHTIEVPYNTIVQEKSCRIAITENSRNRAENDQPAVVVRNVKKKYGSKGPPVLDNFCMTVQKGSIYSLLGSSGCGKTTVLTCIIGIKNTDNGEILVFGQKPGTPGCGIPGKRVGYMPQDIALYLDFSIGEMIGYYGTLYDMSASEIKSNKELLVGLLELPEETRRIATLSGGQKRRVSLAISLMHNPDLLVLDEPTVGVDPLLRESIWNHLIDSADLITNDTYYATEESRKSKTVGLMRGGRLLIEKDPESLIRENGAYLLEDVVLKLCRKDKLANQDDNGYPLLVDNNDANVTPAILNSASEQSEPFSAQLAFRAVENWLDDNKMFEDMTDFKNSMIRIKALAKKNIVVMLRNFILCLFLVLVPGMQLTILCLTVGNDPKLLNMGFVNKEKVDLTHCLIPNQSTGCNVEALSCNYLTKLPSDIINLISYETEDAARDAIKSGAIWGFMAFPEGYSFSLYARAAGMAVNGSMEASQILFEMDMTNKQIGSTMKRVFYEAYKTYIAEILSGCGFPSILGEAPLKYLAPVYGTDDTDFSSFIAPSSLLGAVFFFSLCSSSISYIWDKKQGTLERGLVAGVRTWEIMTAFFLTEACILAMQLSIAFPLLISVFGIEIQGSAVLALLLTILIGFSGVSMGFLIGSLCSEEMEAVLLAMAAYFPNCLLSGTLWPIEGLPVALQYMAYLLPCTLANESIRSIVSRGWGFSHIKVWPGFVNTIAWTAVYWILTIAIRRFSLARK